jgi:hypothetical protein
VATTYKFRDSGQLLLEIRPIWTRSVSAPKFYKKIGQFLLLPQLGYNLRVQVCGNAPIQFKTRPLFIISMPDPGYYFKSSQYLQILF